MHEVVSFVSSLWRANGSRRRVPEVQRAIKSELVCVQHRGFFSFHLKRWHFKRTVVKLELRRDGGSLLQNSSYIQFFFGFAPVWSAWESQRKISTLATDAKRQIEVSWRE